MKEKIIIKEKVTSKKNTNNSKYSTKKSKTNKIHDNNTITNQLITTIDELIDGMKRFQRIIVITGAGISVSCGIPDFRSKDVGLYNNLDCSSINIPSPELLFDLEYFRIDPEPFYKFAELLLPSESILPSRCHRFIGLLEQKKILLRNYTQNVDGLERKVGIDRVIECHGSFSSFKCLDCKKVRKLDNDIESCIRNKKVLYCNNTKCKGDGILKPEIIFFGERVPKIFDKAFKLDLNSKCDCIFVIGTSLKVGGSVHEILKKMDPTIPRILINKNIVEIPDMPNNNDDNKERRGFDLSLLGNCDDIVTYLCSLLGWTIDNDSHINNLNKSWNCQSKLPGIYEISTL